MNIKETAQQIHQNAREKGFWDKERNFGELLMLVTSELAEALEADRKDRRADVKGFNEVMEKVKGTDFEADAFRFFIKDTVEDEIADAVIRLFDLAKGRGMDLEWHIRMKIEFNKTRERLHGKKY